QARLREAEMADVGRLGRSGGAGGVDVEGSILDGDRPPLARAEGGARVTLDRAIDARERVAPAAVNPDRRRRGKTRERRGQRLQELRRDDHVPGRDDVDAVDER